MPDVPLRIAAGKGLAAIILLLQIANHLRARRFRLGIRCVTICNQHIGGWVSTPPSSSGCFTRLALGLPLSTGPSIFGATPTSSRKTWKAAAHSLPRNARKIRHTDVLLAEFVDRMVDQVGAPDAITNQTDKQPFEHPQLLCRVAASRDLSLRAGSLHTSSNATGFWKNRSARSRKNRQTLMVESPSRQSPPSPRCRSPRSALGRPPRSPPRSARCRFHLPAIDEVVAG